MDMENFEGATGDHDDIYCEKYVIINSVPTQVLTYGKWIDEDLSKEEKIILLVPGNPGFLDYYKEYLQCVHEKTGLLVWAVGHAGHSKPPENMLPVLHDNEILYGVEGQIQHKIKFIETYIPRNVQLILIGHSIGAKICLEILKCLSDRYNFGKCYMMFPTIERLKETPNGRFMWPFLKYLRGLIVSILHLLCLLPYTVKRKCIEWRIPDSNDAIEATLKIVDPDIVGNIMFMAYKELETVKDLDTETLEKHQNQIVMYFGMTDHWCPLDYYRDLTIILPNTKAIVCDNGYEHAFVIKSSIPVAKMMSRWIKNGTE